jgi:hypothetical protein
MARFIKLYCTALIYLSLSMSLTKSISIRFPSSSENKQQSQSRSSYISIRANNATVGSIDARTLEHAETDIPRILEKMNMNGKQQKKIIDFAKLEKGEWSKNNDNKTTFYNSEIHPFMDAIHLAYAHHLPLELTPDMIWYLIASGTAQHINLNSERLRNKFVEHEGQKTLEVRRDNFVLGQPSSNSNSTNQDQSYPNRWDEVIDEFSAQIAANTKVDVDKLFTANFTTTTPESRVSSQIVLMDAMKQYFSYRVSTLCDIPEIRLRGSRADWTAIRSRIAKLSALIDDDLKMWYNKLDNIVEKFVDAFDQNIDKAFWNEIYKSSGGSGGPYISGWSTDFFPYLADDEKNMQIWDDKFRFTGFNGLTSDNFEFRLSTVPFVWNYFGREIKMSFVGGMFGVQYDSSGDKTVRPAFGYAVFQN